MLRLARLACLAMLAGGAAQAACQSGLAERLHDKIEPQRVLLHELAVCDAWHGHVGRSVVVLPMPGTAPATLDLDVLVVQQPDNGNSERATIVAQRRQTIANGGADALAVSDIELDTARYRLSPDLRSFGLRITRRSATMDPPAASETLSLYALGRANQLNLLLDELEMRRERGQWGPGCAGRFEKQESQLSVVRTGVASKTLADLLVRSTDSRSVNELQGDECVESSELPRYKESTLRFDGREYRASN